MRAKPGLLNALSALLVAGCAFGYQAEGSLSDISGALRGKGYPGTTQGGGRFALADSAGRLKCDGEMAPPDTVSQPGTCTGESGTGIVRCSDGRRIVVRWVATTCRAFEGRGEDESGNRLNFRVDRAR